MKRISVLLTCHNRKEKTLTCLRKLFEQDIRDVVFDVFLVDDGCTDGTAAAISEEFSQVRIIQGDGSLFWNRGMCLAWEEARRNNIYDGYLWLNDDTMLENSALEVIKKCSIENPGAIVVGSISSTLNPQVVTYGGYKSKKIINPGDKFEECDTFNGNCVYIPKVVSDKIGYLDPYYRHSCGDFDYSWRALKNGIKCLVTPVIGACDRNPPEPIWNKGSLTERFRKLYSPLGNNPFETFHCFKKYSYLKAVYYFLYAHVRVFLTYVTRDNYYNY